MPWTLAASGYKPATAAAVCTMTIASPAVVTVPHTAIADDVVVFTTTGALPTGVTAGAPYYVIATGLTGSQFQFSATKGGAAVGTSGTQSGTHTATFEHALAAIDANNATFFAEMSMVAMISGDLVEARAYDYTISGGIFALVWKGTFQHAQVIDHKAFPFIPSDIGIQYTILARANAYTGTVTFTNASANVTFVSNLLVLNDVVQFTTTGTLPTNFNLLTNYYVVSVGSPFTVSATRGGTAIVAGSAGSGTHTVNRIGHTFPFKILRQ
jgi:hypothetical protein